MGYRGGEWFKFHCASVEVLNIERFDSSIACLRACDECSEQSYVHTQNSLKLGQEIETAFFSTTINKETICNIGGAAFPRHS